MGKSPVSLYGTLMSLVPIRVVHPGADPRCYNSHSGVVFDIIVCTVCVQMTFLVLLFYILKYLLHRKS